MRPYSARRILFIAAISILVLAGIFVRICIVFTEAINWDEFALLARADRALRLGDLAGGGRPGLATLVLEAFVDGCTNPVIAVRNARLAWLSFTLAYFAGLTALVYRWLLRTQIPTRAAEAAIVSVALLAYLPSFVLWSVQVRTDQPAIAFATWGGYFLLGAGSIAGPLAGLLFAIGILFSQKALYVVGLSLWLYVASVYFSPSVDRYRAGRDALLQVALAAAFCAGAVALFMTVFPQSARLASANVISASWDTMDWVRERFGYRAYTREVLKAPLHTFAAIVAIAVLVAGVVRGRREAVVIGCTVAGIATLGVVVALVHGSTFPYFLMTVGMFPCVAIGLTWALITDRLPDSRSTIFLLGLAALALAVAPQQADMLSGYQRQQLVAFDWIGASSLGKTRGYQVEAALFCAKDPNPIPGMFSQQIAKRSEQSPVAFQEFLREFRTRPVAFVVDSYRMDEFPDYVRAFWEAHYVRVFGPVYVTGFDLPRLLTSGSVDVLVEGDYRWHGNKNSSDPSVRIAGITIEQGSLVHLTRGTHVWSKTAPTWGRLTLDVDLAPPSSEVYSLYDQRQVRRLASEE
jgi:hypothetical protein